jgi:hypothetical protein
MEAGKKKAGGNPDVIIYFPHDAGFHEIDPFANEVYIRKRDAPVEVARR